MEIVIGAGRRYACQGGAHEGSSRLTDTAEQNGPLITDPTRKLHLLLTITSENGPMTSTFSRATQQESRSSKATNRRANSRYAVKIPLRYRLASARTLNCGWKPGRCLDMSARGIRVDIPESMPVGSRLELSMDWPGLFHGVEMVRLFLLASVRRVDGRGVALRILRHRFFGSPRVRSLRGDEEQAVA